MVDGLSEPTRTLLADGAEYWSDEGSASTDDQLAALTGKSAQGSWDADLVRAAVRQAAELPATGPRRAAPAENPPHTVVGLAAATGHRSPLTGRTPMAMLADVEPHLPTPHIHLVHGRADGIVAVTEATDFHANCAAAGRPIGLTLIDGDHTGVVGCRFDETRNACVPSDGAGARAGLAAVVAAVQGRAPAD